MKLYVHDEPDALRLEIAGNLIGAGVANVDQAWQTARSILEGRGVIIALASVAHADEHGRDLLLRWHRSGARIVARCPESRALAEGIVGAPISMPASKPGSWQRISEFLIRVLGGGAVRSAEAKKADSVFVTAAETRR